MLHAAAVCLLEGRACSRGWEASASTGMWCVTNGAVGCERGGEVGSRLSMRRMCGACAGDHDCRLYSDIQMFQAGSLFGCVLHSRCCKSVAWTCSLFGWSFGGVRLAGCCRGQKAHASLELASGGMTG
jgi:hypothetical protein